MWSWISKIVSFIPGLTAILGTSKAADEARAQAELEEAKALRKGVVSPRYVRGYLMCLIAFAFCVLLVVDAVWPDAVDLPALDDMVRSLKALLEIGG